MKRVLVVGATSAIAQATAKLFAADGARLFLVARDEGRLNAVADDLRVRGAESVVCYQMDVNDFADHEPMLENAIAALGSLDVLLVAHGTLSDQRACEQDTTTLLQEMQTNCFSVIALLTHAANKFEERKSGTLAVISSVAGDRGRQSNYVYGTAKAAVSTFLQGLRNRLQRSGVKVLTIKPGFVDTPMTAEFPKGPLWAKPEHIAKGIHKAIARKRDVVYLPWFWRLIMGIIVHIPESIFKRLSL